VKKTLRILAVILVLAFAGFWLASGANRGWTKTSVPVKTLDEVTGIEGITYEKKFVPGIDFLTVGVGATVLLAGVSFLFERNQTKSIKRQTK
jgi:TRAP-type C4-dicarboxylate transport system permease small subunit